MRRFIGVAAAAAVLSLSAGQVSAGVYSDDLGKCLVKAASPKDVSVFMVWVFSALTLQPDVAPYSSMTGAQRDTATRDAAKLLERLMTQDCHTETVAALKYEGAAALATGFQVFGEVAGRGLFNSPTVVAQIGKMATYIDEPKFEALGREAGVPVAPAKPK